MSERQLRLGLPKGSLQNSTIELFRKASFSVTVDERAYSPDLGDPELWGVLLRAQELPMYIEHGVLDCGLTGYDWILERNADLVEVCDLIYARRHEPIAGCSRCTRPPISTRWPTCRASVSPPSWSRSLSATWPRTGGGEVEFWGATEAVPGRGRGHRGHRTGSTLRANLRIVDALRVVHRWS